MLDPDELAWLDEQMQGGFRHLLVGTSLPFLLSPACTTSRPGTRRSSRRPGEPRSPLRRWMRQVVDLEHWAPSSTVSGRSPTWPCRWRTAGAGRPDTVTFLSGTSTTPTSRGAPGPRAQVAEPDRAAGGRHGPQPGAGARLRSPHLRPGRADGAVAAKSAHVPDPPFTWGLVNGPWFDNNLAVLEDKGRARHGLVHRRGRGGDHEHPALDKVASTVLARLARPPQPAHGAGVRARDQPGVPRSVDADAEEEVLHHLGERGVDPVLPASDLCAVCPNDIAPISGWIRLTPRGPMRCAPRSRPVSGSASTFAKPVVSSMAQPYAVSPKDRRAVT